MTAKQRYKAIMEVMEYDDPDAFMSDVALSEEFESAKITDKLCNDLRRLWHICHDPIASMLGDRQMTDAAVELCVSYKTLQKWCYDERECPIYVKLYIADTLKYLK